MASKGYSESDGVWRTVGGRRIFIRDGQSLASAMKSSGKFGKKKKIKDDSDSGLPEKRDVPGDYEWKDKEREAEYNRQLDQMREAQKLQREYEYQGMSSRDAYLKAQEEVKKVKNLSGKSEMHKKFEKDMGEELEEHTTADGKKWYSSKSLSDEEKEMRGKIESSKKINEMSIRNNEGKVEKLDMSEVEKIEDAGNRYEMKMKDGTMSVSKDKVTSVNGKDQAPSKNIKTQQSDIEQATGSKVKDVFETDAFGTGKETRFDLGNNKWISHSTESFGEKEDKWSINELKNGKIKTTDYKSYDDMLKNVNKSGSGDWVRNAFNQYKKDHPGSKMTLADFKKTNKK